MLKLIHLDICELINPTSNCGKCYFITFFDDYSKKTLVYFLKRSLKHFMLKLQTLVEKERGSTIQILHSDPGGEYTSQEFVSFVKLMEFKSN